jgi:Sulfotransferase family
MRMAKVIVVGLKASGMVGDTRRVLRFARRDAVSLASNTAHQFALSQAMCIYQPGAIYSFIPKNACSTLRFSVAWANGCVATESDVNWIHENNLAFKPTLGDLATAKYCFVVLRDPFRRIASCFLDKFVDKRPEAWRFQALLDYSINPDTLTFRSFVECLPRVLRKNLHWRPQVDFLVYENYDDWFCLEEFGRAVDTLGSRIGLIVRDTRHLLDHGSYRYKIVDANGRFPDLPVFEIADMKRRGELPAVERMFDDDLRRIIRSAYADDFALYQLNIGRSCLFEH